MDARTPRSGPLPSASRAAASSTGANETLSDPSEHAESPMRKRPRLGSNREPQTHALVDEAERFEAPPPADDSPSVPQTPSKVTLNLRPAASQHSPDPLTESSAAMGERESTEPRSSDSSDGYHGQPSPEPGFVDITAGSPVSSVESPVIEIEVDGSDDLDDGSVVNVVTEDPWSLDEAQLIADFPFASDYGISDAAKLVTNNMAEGWSLGYSRCIFARLFQLTITQAS